MNQTKAIAIAATTVFDTQSELIEIIRGNYGYKSDEIVDIFLSREGRLNTPFTHTVIKVTLIRLCTSGRVIMQADGRIYYQLTLFERLKYAATRFYQIAIDCLNSDDE